MAVAIFIVLPYFLSMLFSHYVRNESLLAILEGVLRIVIFVAYVAGISAMKDIRRVYMYHGAEHKCINCIERGRELTVKNVRKSSRLHKRCGTSFLLFVMLVSVVLFLFIRVQNPLLRLGLRILLIPCSDHFCAWHVAAETDNQRTGRFDDRGCDCLCGSGI